MDPRLLNFIESLHTLGDLRNLDINNPVILEIAQPLTANLYTTVASIVEPSFMAIPINTTWVVLDVTSINYLKALKLKDLQSPLLSGVAGVIVNASYTQSWIELTNFDDIFADGQYYTTGGSPGTKGNTGPQGLIGPQGPQGPSGSIPVIDYAYILEQTLLEIPLPPTPLPVEVTLSSIAIVGESSVKAQATSQYTVTARFTDNSIQVLVTPLLVTPITWVAGTSIGTINSTGLLTAPSATQNTSGTLTASYTVGGVTKTATLTVAIVAKTLSSIAIVGASSITGGVTSSYTLTATFTDGTLQANAAPAVWSANPILGTISAGTLTPAMVTRTTVGDINAAFTYNGVTLTAAKTLTLSSAVVPVYPYYGVAVPPTVKDGAFILSLTGRGTASSLVSTFTLDSGVAGSTTTMFFAYPVSYGLAQFEDQATLGFFGGWDAATGDPIEGAMGPLTVSVMVAGVATPFYLYQTDFPGLGQILWKTTLKV